MLSLRLGLFLAVLTTVCSFLRTTRSPFTKPLSIRRNSNLHASPFHNIFSWIRRLIKTPSPPANPFASLIIPSKQVNQLSIEELRNLAARDVLSVEHFVIDEWTDFTDESLFLISEIVRKTEILQILTDSPLVDLIFSKISYLPVRNLVTSVKLSVLPILPGLESLTLIGPDALEKLNTQSYSLKKMSLLQISDVDSVVLGRNMDVYENLATISITGCAFADLSKFYNRNLKSAVFSDFQEIKLSNYELSRNSLIGPIYLDPYEIKASGSKANLVILSMQEKEVAENTKHMVWEIV
jgi:hypothetical protein